jgi:hypothetical protein
MKTKIVLSGVLALVFVLSVSVFSSCSKEKAISVILDKIAGEANKSCPMSVDFMTRLDSITHPEPMILAYDYTLTVDPEQLAAANVDWSKVKNVLVSSVKSNPQLAPYLKFDITFRHTYFGTDGQQVYQADIIPEDYHN